MILVPLLQFGVLFSLAVSSQEGPAAYAPQGKKDPFEPRIREQYDTVETPLTAPLRQLAISELVIVGTAVGKLGGFALVQGADRLTHLAPMKARFADGHLVGISEDWVIFRVDGSGTDRSWVTKRIRSAGE